MSGFSTKAIHHGYDPREHQGALVPPVYLTSTFTFASAEQGGRCFAGEAPGYIYTRISNPTLALLESRMAALEGGAAAIAFGSGMGAITATLWTLLRPGDEILVMPQVPTRNLELATSITQILYQIAVATKVAVDL